MTTENVYQCINIIGIINGSNRYNLTLDTVIPLPRLSDIEVTADPVLKENPYNSKHNVFNSVNEKQDLFIKKYYEVYETYHVSGEMWDDQSGVYEPSLRIKYYELALPLFREGVLTDMVKEAVSLDPYQTAAKEISFHGLDHVYYVNYGPGSFALMARKKNKIVSLRYVGKQGYAKALEAISETLNR